MKTVFLIFTIITCSLLSFGQKMNFKGGSISLPDGNEKIGVNEAKSHVVKKFKGDRIAGQIISNVNSDHIYRIGNVLLVINSWQRNIQEGHFASLKQSFDRMFRDDASYKAELKQENNNIILTVNHQSGDIGYRTVYANNASNSKVFTALIEYNVADIGQVDKIVKHLINNLSFAD